MSQQVRPGKLLQAKVDKSVKFWAIMFCSSEMSTGQSLDPFEVIVGTRNILPKIDKF